MSGSVSAPARSACNPAILHIGWDEDRYCPNGLFELTPKGGKREVYKPLAEELARLQTLIPAMQPALSTAV